jgi:hypothetical protein
MRDDITDSQIDRFWSRVEPFTALDACWLWKGRTHHNLGRYGVYSWKFKGRRMDGRSHRLAYELLVGDAGETLDHLCRNTLCVNPDHLEPVGNTENIRRGFPGRRVLALGAIRTCIYGHEISGRNAMLTKGRRHPVCRTCAYTRKRRFMERRTA